MQGGLGGELGALGAALAWAIGGLIFSRVPAPASAINAFKNTLGSVLLLITMCAFSGFDGRPLFTAGLAAWGWLGLSSLTGLLVGDTCYFRSLQILGARRGLVLTTFAPPLAAVGGWLVLDETLSGIAVLGMALTLGGVGWVLRERGRESEEPGHYPGSVATGVLFGLLGAAGQAIGGVLSKLGMHAQDPSVDTVEASLIRLLMASVAAIVPAALLGRLGSWRRALSNRGVPSRIIPASVCGTYLGIWASLVAFKYASSVAVATTLMALTPIFVLPLVWIFLRQRVSLRAVVGAGIAVAGVSLLFAGREA